GEAGQCGPNRGCAASPFARKSGKMNRLSCPFLMSVMVVTGLAREAAGAPPLPGQNQSGQAQAPASPAPRIIYTEQDKAVAASLKPHLQQGQQKVERFFGQPFKKAFEVEVHPDRAAFDEYFRKRWKVPKTEAWMVASGVADRLTILSPRVWTTQAA